MTDRIVSHPSTEKYRENWERIWGAPEVKRQKVLVVDTPHGFLYSFLPSVSGIVDRRPTQGRFSTATHEYVLATNTDALRGLDRDTPVLISERMRRGIVSVDLRYVCGAFHNVSDYFDKP